MIVRHSSIGSISLCEIYHNWYQNGITDIGSCLYTPVIFIFFHIALEKDIIIHDYGVLVCPLQRDSVWRKIHVIKLLISKQCASNKTPINTISHNTSMFDVKGAIAC